MREKNVQILEDFRSEVSQKIKNREIITFNISDIDIEREEMSIGSVPFSGQATKKILSKLRVKNNFLGLSKKMNNSDWELVGEKLKNTNNSQTIYGKKIEKDGKVCVDNIQFSNTISTEHQTQEMDRIFSEIIETANRTKNGIIVSETKFLEDKDEVSVIFLDDNTSIDVFCNDTDLWKIGKRVTWDGLNFAIDPFFSRLICSNGNTAKNYGYKLDVTNSRYNSQKIRKVLNKELVNWSNSMDVFLVDSVNHLKSTNVSVNELLEFKKFFDDINEEPNIKKLMDTSYLDRSYGCDISKMSKIWRNTADSGKNAYSFFNDLTYIASHPDEINIPERKRLELQIQASDLLFKDKLDLEQIARKIEWN